MTLNKTVVGIAVAVSATVLATGSASAAASNNADHKICICHATGSTTNPNVFIEVDKNAEQAHANHQDHRDIIGVKSAADCPKAVVSPKTTPIPAPKPTPAPTPKPTPTPTSTTSSKGSVLGAATVAQVETATPTSLPVTGASDLSVLLGIPAIAAAGAGYIQSRRKR